VRGSNASCCFDTDWCALVETKSCIVECSTWPFELSRNRLHSQEAVGGTVC
jgi:hypothetical protein